MRSKKSSMFSMKHKITKVLSHNENLYYSLKYWRLRFRMFFYEYVSDKDYIQRQYKQRTNKILNLKYPLLYNEKVQYSKLYNHDPRMKKLADKAEVRSYVEKCIGSQYMTHLYGVYNTVDEIPFDMLPESFVVKLTNGSGFNYICKKKTDNDIKKIKKRFNQWLKLDFYMLGREWAYKDMKNRIICEEYLESTGSEGLNDYKVFCFNGEPKIIQVDFARFTNHKRNLYTPEWIFLNQRVAYENDPHANLLPPSNLEDMLRCARELSKGFPHVRVDFYSIDNRLIFGEMTFYHGAGYLHFENEDFERQLGSYWEIDK